MSIDLSGLPDPTDEWEELGHQLDADAFDLTNPKVRSRLEDLQYAIESALDRSPPATEQ
jgi:hypothetical protein